MTETICKNCFGFAYHDGVVFLGPELPGQLVRGAPVGGVVGGQVDLVRDLERRRLILDDRNVLVLEQPDNDFAPVGQLSLHKSQPG